MKLLAVITISPTSDQAAVAERLKRVRDRLRPAARGAFEFVEPQFRATERVRDPEPPRRPEGIERPYDRTRIGVWGGMSALDEPIRSAPTAFAGESADGRSRERRGVLVRADPRTT